MARKIALVLISILLSFGAAAAAEFTVTAPVTVDSSFDAVVSVSEKIGNVRGVEFKVYYSISEATTDLEFTGATTTDGLTGLEVSANENGKVVVYSPTATDIEGDIIKLHFKSVGSEGDKPSIYIDNILISADGNLVGGQKTGGVVVTLSACAEYPNTKTGEGGGIPGTDCGCVEGATLYNDPVTLKWSCEFQDATDLFGPHAEACGEDGDPIYNTGYCCKEGYKLNESINHFDELTGDNTHTCVIIPNTAPRANIFNAPNNVTPGFKVNFSAAGSSDSDGSIKSYLWDFGDDSTPSSLPSTIHTYQSNDACLNSVCVVKLTVTDDDGATDDATAIVKLLTDGKTPVPSNCGNNIVEVGEICDGVDDAECESGICNSDCSACIETSIQQPTPPITPDPTPPPTTAPPQTAPPLTPTCGNAICETGESPASCLQDCHLNDGICQKSYGESPDTAPLDCQKSNTNLILAVLALALLGGGGFIAIKKGWISAIGPFGHHGFEDSTNLMEELDKLSEKHEVAKPHNDTGKLANYVKETKSQGFSYSQIKNSLKKKGWKEATIDAAFAKLG